MNQQAAPQLPKVSVIIAVYNNSKYLPAAINSALAQDYPNLDIWVVDDCSTEEIEMPYLSLTYGELIPYLKDRIEEVEKHERYNPDSRRDRPLYYLRLRKNGGPSRARNIAIANAMKNGSHLFQILDSDDQMYPNKVSELIKPILMNPERVAVTYADYNIMDERTGSIRYESKFPYDWYRFFGGEDHIHSGFLISSLAIKDFYPQFYPEHLRVTEDYYLLRKVLRSTQWVAIHVAQPLTLVLSHSNDSTNSVQKAIWEDNFRKTMMET